MQKNDNAQKHETTETAISILEYIKDNGGATVQEIIEHFNIAKTTAYTHINTLRHEGFVVRDRGQFVVGLRFREFSQAALTRDPLYSVIKQRLQEITAETELEIEFLVEENGRLNLVYHSEDLTPDTRTHLYMHNTAGGKAILANIPDERTNQILDRWGLVKVTPYTITDRAEIMEELAEVYRRGYSYTDQECYEGYHGIGATIEDVDGTVIGALTIGGPVYRVSESELKNANVSSLLTAVDEVERAIELERDSEAGGAPMM